MLHDKLYPAAQVHLYDHLTSHERGLEIKWPQGPHDQAHKRSAEDFAAGEASVAAFGVAEWADRFLEIVEEHRRAQGTDSRPILFICHSTGGIVVKQALSKKNANGLNSVAACCLGVTFFSTPHHGSSVLSEPEYVQTVKIHLGLKWEMSENLRHDFLLRSADLEVGILARWISHPVSILSLPISKEYLLLKDVLWLEILVEQNHADPEILSRVLIISLLSVFLG